MFVTQSCLTLCNHMDCSPPGSSVHGILQVRILEWVAIPFSRGPSWPQDQTQVFWIAGRFFTSWATREAQTLPVCVSLSVVSDFLWSCGLGLTRLFCPWDSPGKNTGVGCHALLQGASRFRDWTWVSCIAAWFFTIWATRVEVIDRLCLFLHSLHSLWQIKTKDRWKTKD